MRINVRIKKKNEERLGPLLASGRVKPLFGSQVVEVTPERVRLKVGLGGPGDGERLRVRLRGRRAPFEFLKQCGVRFGGEEAS